MENSKKQTSVEYLQKELIKFIPKSLDILFNHIIEEAKEIEKQQIIDANLNGSVRTAKAIYCRIAPLRIKELAEQYYNETFNK